MAAVSPVSTVPFADPMHDGKSPVGRQPLQLYPPGTPNGVKVVIMPEKLIALGCHGAEHGTWLHKDRPRRNICRH
jgi:GST-like protein